MVVAQSRQGLSRLTDWLTIGVLTVSVWVGLGDANLIASNKNQVALSQEVEVFSPRAPKVFNPGGEKSPPKRHRISLKVVSLEDLKVANGDTVSIGDLVSDRTEQRISLESQIARIESAVTQSEKAIAPMPALPEPNYAREIAELDRARETAAYWQTVPEPPERFKGWLTDYDFKTIDRRQTLEIERVKSRLSVQTALARLKTAEQSYEQLLYQHQLEKADYDASRQRQQYQIGQLQKELAELQDRLERLSVVRSPVAGKVRRVRVLSQNDREISVEVIIDVEGA